MLTENEMKILGSLYEKRLDISQDIARTQNSLQDLHSELRNIKGAIAELELKLANK